MGGSRRRFAGFEDFVKICVTIGRRHAYNAPSTQWRGQARRPEFREDAIARTAEMGSSVTRAA
jgi:hypothetical protein